MAKILIIGSISLDNVVYTETMPSRGTTVFGKSYFSNVGGKGANQACASLFLGGDVIFYGALGKDKNGEYASSFLKEQGLNCLLKESNKGTGYASITVDTIQGENQIVIVPGANLDIHKEDIDKIDNLFKEADYFLIQLENPVETVVYALKKAKEYGCTTLLNPAPYHELPEEVFPYIDFFIPNEHELDSYVDVDISYSDKAKALVAYGVKNVIVTLGENGSLLVNKDEEVKVEAHKVKAVDTTGAGDSFIGAFLTALSQGKSVTYSMEFASLCSSKTVCKKGAILSLPKLTDL